MKVRIICVGNEYRGDDAAGLAVARALRTIPLPENVEIREASGEVSSLLDAFAGAEAVILVDAMVTGSPPGTQFRADVRELALPLDLFVSSTHALGVAHAVEFARALDLLPQHIVVYGIEGHNVDLGAPMCPMVVGATGKTACAVAADALRFSNE